MHLKKQQSAVRKSETSISGIFGRERVSLGAVNSTKKVEPLILHYIMEKEKSMYEPAKRSGKTSTSKSTKLIKTIASSAKR